MLCTIPNSDSHASTFASGLVLDYQNQTAKKKVALQLSRQ